jgi:hypothetical protein
MPNLEYSRFDGDEYVAMSLIRRAPALPVARDERKRALIKVSAALLGYMLVVFGLLELSARY